MTTMNNEDPADTSVHEQRELPEPVAYLPAYELDRLRSGHTAMLRSAKFGPSEMDGDVPVYTADQMREAIAAERERSHELLQAADHIRAGLEAKLAALSAALAEKEQPK